MIELGFVPTFYQFVETIIEVRISISIHGSTDDTRSNSTKVDTIATTYSNSGYWWYYNQGAQSTNVTAAQVNASYSSKYSYDVTGSSYLKTKLVPVPPPPILEARIRDLMEIERAYLKANPDQAKQTVRHQPPKLRVSTVSASFASKYQYSAEGSSLMRTKLVPVPPPGSWRSASG